MQSLLYLLLAGVSVEAFSIERRPFYQASYPSSHTGITSTGTCTIGAIRAFSRNPRATDTTTSLHQTRRGTELSRYKTRAAILQYTLKTKEKEYKLQDSKLQILQSVIQKLQSSNKNLLDKIKELQQERDGIHFQPQSDEIWPPDMEAQLIKEEFYSKEVEWENTLNMAQVKFQKMRSSCQSLVEEATARDADIVFYQERAKVDESEMVLLRKEVEEREELVASLEEEKDDLQNMLGKQRDEINIVENKGHEREKLVASLEEEKDDLQNMLEKQRDEINSVENKGHEERSDNDDIEMQEDERLEKLQNQVEELTEQNAKAKEQLLELGTKRKSRREEMEKLIEKEQDKILVLQEKFSNAESEKKSLQEKYKQSAKEFESLQNSTNLASIEKENLAKQMSKESLEIATAAVLQSEERERELEKKLNGAQTQLQESKIENTGLSDKVSELETQLGQIREMKEKQQTNALVKKLQVETEDSEHLKWEKRLSDQENEYEGRIQELKSRIEELAKDGDGEVDGQLVEHAGAGDNTREIVVVSVPRQRRLSRLVNRIKSVLKK